VNRRAFLAAAPIAAVAGCRRPNSPDAARVAAERAARGQHLADLAGFRVPPDATLTTPNRPVDLVQLFPEVKPLLRVTLRLHPRFSDEPAAGATKLGGRFLWPAGEPWPACEVFNVPLAPVLQLTADDAPPQVTFKPGTDLLQVLWSPRDHGPAGGPRPRLVWRKRADVTEPVAELPDTTNAFLGYVPVPCRVFPERVTELPDWHTVRVTPLRAKIEGWKPDGGRNPVEFYETELSAAPGTKVGGYPRWRGTPNPPACATCKRGMDYLLTVDSDEWAGGTGWVPVEEHRHLEHGRPGPPGYARAAGLTLPEPGNVHVYVCRRCDDWPVKATR
jgi:hypothetical protein